MKIFFYVGWMFILLGQLKAQDFVRVEGAQLQYKGESYEFIGTNLWQAVSWAIQDPEKLGKELDVLDSLGIRNIRVLASAQGPLGSAWRISEHLEISPHQIDSNWLKGLDLLLNELDKRAMKAVLCLGNFWHWSGGFAQYVAWASGDRIPYPPPAEGGDWQVFEGYVARFYKNRKAKGMYNRLLDLLVNRKNSINGRWYKSDPTIMAWQLCNEPRAAQNPRAFRRWINKSATKLKKLGVQQLLSTGSEGLATNWQNPKALKQWEKAHRNKYIDYLTVHLWPQNWGWYDPQESDSLTTAQIQAYIQTHLKISQVLNKPLVLEEFGLARDQGSYSPNADDQKRRDFYELIFEIQLAEASLSGCNFWAWSGENYPTRAGAIWQKEDPYCGDPPHELQGWYSVYQCDQKILELIKEYQNKERDKD